MSNFSTDSKGCGTFPQQLECGYRFPALIHVWIASAGVIELFILLSTSDEAIIHPFLNPQDFIWSQSEPQIREQMSGPEIF